MKTHRAAGLEAQEALTRRELLRRGAVLASGLPLVSLAFPAAAQEPPPIVPVVSPSGPEMLLLASIASSLGVVAPYEQPDPKDTSITLQKGAPWPPGAPAAWSGAFDRYANGARKGGSENWPMMCLAAVLLLGTAEEKAEADARAVAWLTEQKTSRGWMGTEIGSRVYWYMHVEPALVFLRVGSAALKSLALEWLALFVFWLRRGWSAPLRRVLWFGQRSAEPGREQADLIDEVAAWINDAGPFPNPGRTLDRLILVKLQTELAQAVGQPLSNPTWQLVEPVTFFLGTDGSLAVYMPREVNANTPPILAASTVGGKLQWAPAPPFKPIRQTPGNATCVEDPEGLTYKGNLYPTARLPLPSSSKRLALASGTI